MTLERNSDLHKEMKCARKGIKRANKEIKQPNLLLTDTKCGKLHEPDVTRKLAPLNRYQHT